MKRTTLLIAFLLGIISATCFAQENDISKLTELAEQGDAKAQTELGKCYYNGKNVAKDYAEAFKWFQKAADNGYAEGQYRLGRMYNYGEGINKNKEIAVKLYRQAAQQGYPYAQKALGLCFEEGTGIDENQDSAKYWYDKAYPQICIIAESGDLEGEYHLGNCFYFEQGVPQNYEEAVKWYRKAAEHGHSYAQNDLGFCYHYGQGVPENSEEAIKWYKKAAENGYIDANHGILDIVYGCGSCGKDSIQKALQKVKSNYMKEVNKGNTSAMIGMGDVYSFYYGYFPDIDWEKAAITWYNLAVEQGDPDAIAALAALYDRLYDYPERFAPTSPGPTRLKDYEKDVPEYDNSTIDASVKIERDVHEYVPKYDTLRNDTLKLYTERLWQLAADKGSARAQAIIGFKCFLEKNFEKAMEWYAKAKKNGATKVWRVVNVNLPIDMAIMLCEHFKEHSSEYDFYFYNIFADNEWKITYGSGTYYGWYIFVFPSTIAGSDGFLEIYVPGDIIYVTVAKNNKYGLIKLSKDGKLLEKTPIIYDSEFRYDEYDETGKFHTTLNGQDVQFDL